jgi:hypothetical protein
VIVGTLRDTFSGITKPITAGDFLSSLALPEPEYVIYATKLVRTPAWLGTRDYNKMFNHHEVH